MSPNHLARYVSEFVGRKNLRQKPTLNQMQHLFRKLVGKQLTAQTHDKPSLKTRPEHRQPQLPTPTQQM